MTESSDGIKRRDFIAAALQGAAGAYFLFSAPPPAGADEAPGYDPSKHHWAYLVDLTACIGCGSCVRACKAENSVPDGFFRTWVERYTFLKNGEVHVDSPDGAVNGFSSDPTDVDPDDVVKSFFVPKLCNHCVESPCVQVCPVGASYESKDGVVLVDKNYCIGCGYCIQACPYGCRYLHPSGTADKCTLCYHRITKGLAPACVASCPVQARQYGDLNNPDDPLRKKLDALPHGVLKPELGTHPQCSYIGLDQEVR